ncbi:MAG: thermonuclease family protein [Nitrospinota bacterium]
MRPLLPCLLALWLLPSPARAEGPGELARILRVIDGDTVVTADGRRVRYLGIDAPEVHHPRRPPGCLGAEAAALNRRLVEGRAVRLERDLRDVDRYGRLLRYVHLLDEAGRPSLFVNGQLVRLGLARALLYRGDVKERASILAAEAEAKRHQRGIWGAACGKGSLSGARAGTPSRRASAPGARPGPA